MRSTPTLAAAAISAASCLLAVASDAKSPVAWAFAAGYLLGAILVASRRTIVIGGRTLVLVASVDLLGVTASLAVHNWDRVGLKLLSALMNVALIVACRVLVTTARDPKRTRRHEPADTYAGPSQW